MQKTAKFNLGVQSIVTLEQYGRRKRTMNRMQRTAPFNLAAIATGGGLSLPTILVQHGWGRKENE
jgi:hypothetical protein